MCIRCYNVGRPPMTAAPIPAPPAAAPMVRFAVPPAPGWTCYPSAHAGVHFVPPPPVVAQQAPPPAAPTPKKKVAGPSAPPHMVTGASYCFPLKHTYVHVIRGVKVWESNAGKFSFKKLRVPTSLSVGEFLEAVTGGQAAGLECTEVVELGDGDWSKGTTVTYGSKNAGKTMSAYGWNEKRGVDGGRPPVWLVIHKP